MRGHIMNVETSYYGVSVAGEARLVGSNSCHAVRAPRKAVNRSTFNVPRFFCKVTTRSTPIVIYCHLAFQNRLKIGA